MPELPAPVPAPVAPPGSTSEGLGRIGAPTAGATPRDLNSQTRQRDAVVTKELSSMKSRLTVTEGDISTLQSMIVELQNRDEESKREREDLTLRLQATEAQAQYLQGLLLTYLESQGVRTDELGGATTMSEVIVGNVTALSADESRKIMEIMNESLASLYGVKKFSPKEHGRYPKVSKSHLEWPSRNEGGARVALHRFKWDEAYNSPLNQPTFSAWVDHSIQQGPKLTGHLDLPSSILNQRIMTSQCSKRYSAIKQQVMRYYGEKNPKIAGIKRRGEGLDAPEGNVSFGNEAGPSAEDTVDAGPDDQFYGNPGHDAAPLLDPSLLGTPVQVGSVADLPILDAVPGSGITDSSDIHGVSEDVKTAVPDSQAKDFNSKNNIRSRKTTKLATRSRQRRALSGADAKFKASKYDTYETIGAMSEDERVDSVNEKGEIVTTFITHAYDFLSQEMIDCRNAIDRVPDPTKSSKKVIRQRGSLRAGPPPKAKVEGGLRSWMIRAEVLVANPQWITEGRVYMSGPEWGEAEAEEQVTHKPKKPKLETNPNLKSVQKREGAWLEAKQKYEDWKKSQAPGTEASGSGSGP